MEIKNLFPKDLVAKRDLTVSKTLDLQISMLPAPNSHREMQLGDEFLEIERRIQGN